MLPKYYLSIHKQGCLITTITLVMYQSKTTCVHIQTMLPDRFSMFINSSTNDVLNDNYVYLVVTQTRSPGYINNYCNVNKFKTISVHTQTK